MLHQYDSEGADSLQNSPRLIFEYALSKLAGVILHARLCLPSRQMSQVMSAVVTAKPYMQPAQHQLHSTKCTGSSAQNHVHSR